MIISDLNTLEVVDGASIVGGFFSLFSTVAIRASASGNLAESDSTANAFGPNTATETDTSTFTVFGRGSSSSGTSISVSSR